MKFQVTKAYMDSVKRQLNVFEDEGIITEEQKSRMVDSYEVAKGVNLIRLISVVGSVLVGLGILTYIAGNWHNMSPTIRMTFIIIGMVGFYVSGMQLDQLYPKTARALRYIALFIFGGGLFLTDQTFHLNRNVSFHFLVWASGLLIAMQFEKDNFLLYFFQALIGASSVSLFDSHSMTLLEFMTYFAVVLIGVLLSVRLSDIQYRTKLSAFLCGINILFAAMTVMVYFEVEALYFASIVMLLGLVFLMRTPVGRHATELMNQLGLIVAGFAGFALTFSDPWQDALHIDGNTPSIIFTVVLILGLFYLVKREFVGAIGFIALIIMRYYFDTFYDFMPKSLFFVIGGGILIGFGVYLESVRRKGLKKHA